MMKKTPPSISRKHGHKARVANLSQWLELNLRAQTETHAPRVADRVTTKLSCSKSGQAYFWLTDRGRSRVIKH